MRTLNMMSNSSQQPNVYWKLKIKKSRLNNILNICSKLTVKMVEWRHSSVIITTLKKPEAFFKSKLFALNKVLLTWSNL